MSPYGHNKILIQLVDGKQVISLQWSDFIVVAWLHCNGPTIYTLS